MRSRLLSFLIPVLLGSFASAQMQAVRIGIVRDKPTTQVIVMFGKNGGSILRNGKLVAEVPANDGLRLEATVAGVNAKSLKASFTAKEGITVIGNGPNPVFRLRTLDQKMTERTYNGSLDVRVEQGRLRLVNEVKLEEYVAGVLICEAGDKQDIEYYKLQAVSCRTYALVNFRRHAPEGFELCDGTHCQVYRGRCNADTINAAVMATRSMVVVDAGIHLIHATFHSNCGGETMNAEDLWSKSEPYLCATVDTFCLRSPHAVWTKIIPRKEWLGYLNRRFAVLPEDSVSVQAATHYQPSCREIYLGDVRPLVPLEDVRTDLHLRSAFFTVTEEGENVVFSGRGFGHGVGLCQEGAMLMARNGYSYQEILHHYFAEVHLVDLATLDFFRDEEQ